MEQCSDPLLRRQDVLALLNVHRATLWRWRRDGVFPKPFKLPSGSVRWSEADVLAWLASCRKAGGSAR